MNQKTLNKLEYNKIIAILEEQASSMRGRQLCRKLKPMTDLERINTCQEQTSAAFTRIIKKGRLSLSDAFPVGESLKRLEIGGTLGSGELLRKQPHAPSHTGATIHRMIWRTAWMCILNSWNL